MPDAAGVAVVDEDRRPAGLEVDVRREAADVPAVAHRPERQQRDQRVLGRVQRREQHRHLLQAVQLRGRRGRTRPPRSRSVVSGRSSGTVSSVSPSADRLALVGDDLLGHRDAAEVELEPEPPLAAQRLLDRRLGLLLRLRVPVDGGRRDDAPRAPRGRASGRGTARRGGGRRRPRGRSSRRASARRARAPSPSRASTTVNESRSRRAQRHARRRVVACRPRRSRPASASSSGEHRRALERLGAERLGVRARRSAPRTRPRARARRARAGSRGRGSPPRRVRPSSVSGSRMKNWSSASSLATSTASPCPRRPARPHCCRSEETVPGKPTEIAQSSEPMSMPSSSASVAETPSSSPAISRRSISRRCDGV